MSGLTATVFALFCGFMILEQNFPPFWTFMYWLDPLHYALEGINMTQFHLDNTLVTSTDGITTTAEAYISTYFSTWRYENVNRDVLILCMYIIFLKICTFASYLTFNHEKR